MVEVAPALWRVLVSQETVEPWEGEETPWRLLFLAFSSRSLLNSPIRASREEPLHWLSRFVSSYALAPDSNQRLLALQTKLLIIAQWRRTCNAHLLSREVSFFTTISIHPCMIVITNVCRFYRCTLLHMLKYFSRLQKC